MASLKPFTVELYTKNRWISLKFEMDATSRKQMQATARLMAADLTIRTMNHYKQLGMDGTIKFMVAVMPRTT